MPCHYTCIGRIYYRRSIYFARRRSRCAPDSFVFPLPSTCYKYLQYGSASYWCDFDCWAHEPSPWSLGSTNMLDFSSSGDAEMSVWAPWPYANRRHRAYLRCMPTNTNRSWKNARKMEGANLWGNLCKRPPFYEARVLPPISPTALAWPEMVSNTSCGLQQIGWLGHS